MRSPHTVLVQLLEAALRNVVLRHAGDEFRFESVIGQRYGHIRLTAAESGGKLCGLAKTQVVRGCQTQHDLSEGYNFLHCSFLCFIYYIGSLSLFIILSGRLPNDPNRPRFVSVKPVRQNPK